MIRVLVPLAWIALALALAGASAGAAAQSVVHYREGERVEPEQVRQILDAADAPTTRSIRILEDGPATTVAAALSLPVQFEFDSADILPSARGQLDALAQGIKLLPPGRHVVIEGHTDATGGDDYNLQLSRRRASAVKDYLVQKHGIDRQRLEDVGLGKRQPIAGADPFSGENRRVQFRGAGPARDSRPPPEGDRG